MTDLALTLRRFRNALDMSSGLTLFGIQDALRMVRETVGYAVRDTNNRGRERDGDDGAQSLLCLALHLAFRDDEVRREAGITRDDLRLVIHVTLALHDHPRIVGDRIHTIGGLRRKTRDNWAPGVPDHHHAYTSNDNMLIRFLEAMQAVMSVWPSDTGQYRRAATAVHQLQRTLSMLTALHGGAIPAWWSLEGHAVGARDWEHPACETNGVAAALLILAAAGHTYAHEITMLRRRLLLSENNGVWPRFSDMRNPLRAVIGTEKGERIEIPTAALPDGVPANAMGGYKWVLMRGSLAMVRAALEVSKPRDAVGGSGE